LGERQKIEMALVSKDICEEVKRVNAAQKSLKIWEGFWVHRKGKHYLSAHWKYIKALRCKFGKGFLPKTDFLMRSKKDKIKMNKISFFLLNYC
jgi:hypothetical protein